MNARGAPGERDAARRRPDRRARSRPARTSGKPPVVLVHWNAAEAGERAARLTAAGYDARALHDPKAGLPALRAIAADPPAAIVIDLSRVPSRGRAVATVFRQQKGTRSVPLLFVDGDPQKVARMREAFPDAPFTDWRRIRAALRAAIARPPVAPRVPGTMEAYSGTPLPRKLGIREGTTVLLLGAPVGFERTLGASPAGARVTRRARRGAAAGAGLVLLFARTVAQLERRLPGALRSIDARKGLLWIVWPKKASGFARDLGEREVRKAGLAAGLVDFKICAVDDVWSGLCFSPRRR